MISSLRNFLPSPLVATSQAERARRAVCHGAEPDAALSAFDAARPVHGAQLLAVAAKLHTERPVAAWDCVRRAALHSSEPLTQTLCRTAAGYESKRSVLRGSWLGLATGGVLAGLGMLS